MTQRLVHLFEKISLQKASCGGKRPNPAPGLFCLLAAYLYPELKND